MGKKQNKKLFKGCLTINVLFVVLIFFTTNASADFYVIAGSRGVGTKITSLPYIIASSGFYHIDKDLSCLAENHGITINADNVTLDLMGFSLIGPGGAISEHGIHMNVRTNVEIQNGTVNDFAGYGISEQNTAGEGHRVINIRVKNNGSGGIRLGSYNSLVKGCTSTNNAGVGISAGRGSTVIGNNSSNNFCIGILGNNGSTLTHNTSYDNTTYGIVAGIGCTATNNTCYKNDLGINSDSGCTITGNTTYDNTSYGIYLNAFSIVDQNSSYSNGITNITTCANCVFGRNYSNDQATSIP